jgi:long-chain acyl-CoA synthetase
VNLATIIEPHAADHPAIVSQGRVLTYGELRDSVAAARGGLAALGVVAGDRVVICSGNDTTMVISYFAVLGLGAIAVPLNPMSPAAEFEREINDVGASVVMLSTAGAATWSDVDRNRIPSVRHLVAPASSVVIPDAVSFESLLESSPIALVDAADDDIAVLVFTSGTAGAPRAAMLSHGNLRSNIEQTRSTASPMTSDDVVYGVLPTFHIFGLNVMLGASFTAGALVILVQRFDPATLVETVAQRGVTVIPGAPPLWTAIAQMDGLSSDAFAPVRLALTGAARMPEEPQRRLREMYGLELREGYGLTEAAPVVTSSVGITVRPGSVGRVVPGIEVRLVDESGADALEGDPGELWVKGPNVFKGYWNDAEATARVLTDDGWLRTGDMAIVDGDGYLHLVDRVKDLIIVSGFNVYPAEVEEVLGEHPGVSEAGVVAVPHPHTGEAVKAYVVPEPGATLDEESLIDFCLDRISRYKCPSKIVMVDELPRNLSGKLIRRALI